MILRRARATFRLGRCRALLALWVFATLLGLAWTPGGGTSIAHAVVGPAPQAGAYAYDNPAGLPDDVDDVIEQGSPSDVVISGASTAQEWIVQRKARASIAPPSPSALVVSIYDHDIQLRASTHPLTGPDGTAGDPVGDLSSRHSDRVAAKSGSAVLDWSRATINDGGVAAVERHLARFDPRAGETAMLERLRSIKAGGLDATGYDLRFYTHELRESVLYRKAGYPTGQPGNADTAYDLWDTLHTQALQDYGLTRAGAPVDLFHPSVRP